MGEQKFDEERAYQAKEPDGQAFVRCQFLSLP